MPKKTVAVRLDGVEIRLENTWFSGARLFVDNKQVAESLDYFALDKHRPLMTARVSIAGKERLVEAFIHALIFVKLKICVDGVQVAGDRL